MAGYSGTPLPQKLGIDAGKRVALIAAPKDFHDTLGPPPLGVELATSTGKRTFDVIVFFTRSRAELERRFGPLAARLEQTGGLWIAWPKKSSGVRTDMTEDAVRAVALPAGLVDNKVCAIDDTWSALRCVIRKENRKPVRR